MLVICFSDGYDAKWHLNDGNPIDASLTRLERQAGRSMTEEEHGITLSDALAKVYMIQADGDELLYIRQQYGYQAAPPDGNTAEIHIMPSIPFPKNDEGNAKRIIRWYGDIARTILLNL
jgi:hypothetical protein